MDVLQLWMYVVNVGMKHFSGLWFISDVCSDVCRFADAALWPPSHFGDTEGSPLWKLFGIFLQNIQMFASLSCAWSQSQL